jgi:glycogen operon protein
VKLGQPDWSGHSHSVAFTAELQKEKMLLHLILNAYWEPLEFELPPLDNSGMWRRWIDTALESPQDIVPWQTSPAISGSIYRAELRSVVVLFAGV